MATSPYEILAGPAEVFIAPTGEPFPAIDADPPGGNWTSLGKTEGGVTVTHNQTTNILRVDQDTGPQKVVRSEEEVHVTFSLAELTLENYAQILNGVTVTDTAPGAGQAGHRSIPLRQGSDVKQFALLVRGPSPYGDWKLQYEFPVAVQVGEPAPAFVKDDKAVLEVDWLVLEDPNAASQEERFGRLRAQDAAPLS